MSTTGTTRRPCGCAGSTASPGVAGTASGTGCGCGSGCSSCGPGATAAGSFSRPAFFDGMLLTEDDLQATIDYVIGKRRLTNRNVLGSGVVCGLDVDCEPCDRGSVLVAPGYAIDCCGNDIVVGCPETVDIMALLQDLRQRNGTDCGQPCDDDPCTYYYLSVSYAEVPSDPVAPYSQDDCAVGGCEFSRVRETYRFELSCGPPADEPGLVDRLRDCLPAKNERTREDAATMSRVVQVADVQAQIATVGPATLLKDLTVPVKADYDGLEKTVTVQSALGLIGRSLVVLSAESANPNAGTTEDGSAVGGNPNHLAYRVNARRQESIREQTGMLARRLLDSDELAAGTAADRDLAGRMQSLLQDSAALAKLSDTDKVWLTQGLTESYAATSYSVGAEQVRAATLRGLVGRGQSGCAAYRDVSGLRLDRLDATSIGTARTLANRYLEVLDCVCDAVNPPCPTCTDRQVLLARIQVSGCDVVDVCSVVRRWVLGPRTLGYWFPIEELLHGLLAERCCSDCEKQQPPKSDTGADYLTQFAHEAVRLVRPPADDPALRPLMAALNGASAPAAAATATAPAPPISTDADKVRQLEQQVAALTARIDRLTADLSGDR